MMVNAMSEGTPLAGHAGIPAAEISVTLVAAITRDRGLGMRGELLYRIGADMRHFKSLTMGHPLIMGRRTYESLPGGPLPGRLNIVMTRSQLSLPAGAVVAHTPADALRLAAEWRAAETAAQAMVIGGGEVYRTFLPLASAMELTEIDAPAPAGTDTWFPPYDPGEWTQVAATEPEVDPRSALSYRFITLRRR